MTPESLRFVQFIKVLLPSKLSSLLTFVLSCPIINPCSCPHYFLYHYIHMLPFFKYNIQFCLGPASYSVTCHTIVDKVAKKKCPYSTVTAPFEKLAPRKIAFFSDDVYNMPGPDQYSLDKENAVLPGDSSVFKSTVNRFPPKKIVVSA